MYLFWSFITDGSSLYRAFLLREFSNENLEFWLAVEDYKNSKPQKMAAKAQQIYNDFVAVEASKEVCFQSVIDSFFFIDFDLISAGFLFFVTKLTPSISISCFFYFQGQSGCRDKAPHIDQHPVE